MKIDLSEIAHRLPPQALESRGQVLCELQVIDEHGEEASLRHERVVEGQDDGAIVDHMEEMSQLARIADADGMRPLVSEPVNVFETVGIRIY
jgi:hypothetical protein